MSGNEIYFHGEIESIDSCFFVKKVVSFFYNKTNSEGNLGKHGIVNDAVFIGLRNSYRQ